MTTIYTGEAPPARLSPRRNPVSALQQAMKFYECSCKGLHTKIEPSNTDASELGSAGYTKRASRSVSFGWSSYQTD